ncbi:MAG: hypothetical protein KAV00_08255, partial [Phycisphaerae bacterium]|nr:hypothetical protein [Phycisphaerae bacterium]
INLQKMYGDYMFVTTWPSPVDARPYAIFHQGGGRKGWGGSWCIITSTWSQFGKARPGAGQDRLIAAALNNLGNWHFEKVAKKIRKADKYTVAWKPKYPGLWRMVGCVGEGDVHDFRFKHYSFDVRVDDPEKDRFVFKSPATGWLEYVVVYLYDRTERTPKNISTPMDVYRESIGNEKPRRRSDGPFKLMTVGKGTVSANPEHSKPQTKTKSGIIMDWLVCGPFPNPGIHPYSLGYDFDFLKEHGGEAKIKPRRGMTVKLKAGRRREWWPFHSIENSLDFRAAFIEEARVAAYAACYIESQDDKEVLIKFGRGGAGYKMWLNHALIGKEQGWMQPKPDQKTFKVSLKKGLNPLLIKCDVDRGWWRIYVRLTDLEGKKAPDGVRIWLDPTGYKMRKEARD